MFTEIYVRINNTYKNEVYFSSYLKKELSQYENIKI